MKIHISDTNNPFFNLALEEWALKNYDASNEDLMILYINKPCVVVGRNQNIFEEVNVKYCFENNIELCRRVSGGGTVFHDYGNANWAVISNYDSKKVNQYSYFATPLLSFLKQKKLRAYLNERNGIEVDGLKISGQAQFASKKNILSHGTLLVKSLLENMQKAIEPDTRFLIESKASKSVRSKVANISTLLNESNTTYEIIEQFSHFLNASYFELSVENKNEVREIEKKYKSNEWLIEKSPPCKIFFIKNKKEEFIEIEKGIIINSSIPRFISSPALDFLAGNF